MEFPLPNSSKARLAAPESGNNSTLIIGGLVTEEELEAKGKGGRAVRECSFPATTLEVLDQRAAGQVSSVALALSYPALAPGLPPR